MAPAEYNGGAEFTQLVRWYSNCFEFKTARILAKQMAHFIDTRKNEPKPTIPMRTNQ
jgi:hypothetical protein